MESNIQFYEKQLNQSKELLIELGLMYQFQQKQLAQKNQALTELGKELMRYKSSFGKETEEQKIISWIRDMYKYSRGGRSQLASKASPKITYNSPKNRPWVDSVVRLILRLEIAIESKSGSLFALCSLGEAEYKIAEHFNQKRRVVIDG